MIAIQDSQVPKLNGVFYIDTINRSSQIYNF